MPWFKVDDTLAFHMKTVKAGNAAMGMWVRAGSWSMQTLSDGYVPDEIASQLGTTQQAARLVDVGLWDKVPGGFSVHDFHDYNPSAADVRRKRAARSAAGRAGAAERWGSGDGKSHGKSH